MSFYLLNSIELLGTVISSKIFHIYLVLTLLKALEIFARAFLQNCRLLTLQFPFKKAGRGKKRLQLKMKRLFHNLWQNLCRLFQAQFPFATSETKLDYFHQKVNIWGHNLDAGLPWTSWTSITGPRTPDAGRRAPDAEC